MTNPQSDQSQMEFSPITNGARRLFSWIKWLSPSQWLKRRWPLLRPGSELTPQEALSEEFAKKRARAIDTYIFCWWIIEAIFVVISCIEPWPTYAVILFAIPPILRIVEILQVTVNATLFDVFGGQPDKAAASPARLIVRSGINFLELAACFGIIYAMNINHLPGAGNPLTAYHISIITQLISGYGDVYPADWLRILASVQGLMSLLFIGLVFGRFIVSLLQVRSRIDNKQP
jgi:hypothetical protein